MRRDFPKRIQFDWEALGKKSNRRDRNERIAGWGIIAVVCITSAIITWRICQQLGAPIQ